MKKNILFSLACFILCFVSCEKDDHDDDCHECHVAYMLADNTEIEVPITNSEGGDEFCGTELEDVETEGYTHTIDQTIIDNDTIPAGDYPVHCEDHGDHDH